MKRLATVLALSALVAAPAAAQIPVLDIRVGAQAIMPTGDLSDVYKTGFGAYGRIGVPVGMMKLMGTVTFNRLPGKSIDVLGTPVAIDDEDIVGLAVGPHFALPLVDAGLEIGYFSNFEKVGFIPSVSVGLGKLDFMASYTVVNSDPKSNWFGFGVGLRF